MGRPVSGVCELGGRVIAAVMGRVEVAIEPRLAEDFRVIDVDCAVVFEVASDLWCASKSR